MPFPSERAAVHSLDHFAITVPDLAVARRFYEDFGLSVTEDESGLAIGTFGADHVWGRVLLGAAKRLHHLSFGAYENDLPALAANLRALGIAPAAPPPGFDANTLWFRDFDDVAIEIRVASKSSPDAKLTLGYAPKPAGSRGCHGRSSAGPVRPQRLAHILNFTSDVPRAIGFYSDALGVRLSDQSGGDIAFLHGAHGSDHHMIAFARSEGPGFHHCSWDVAAFEEVGRGGHAMEALGHGGGWGVGRHVLGSNFFFYVRDPWNSYCEYSYDMDYVPKDHVWPAGDFPSKDAVFQWGPKMPADFILNYEIGDGSDEPRTTIS